MTQERLDPLVKKLISNMDQYRAMLSTKLKEPRLTSIMNLLSVLKERIMVCPAATRLEQPGCYEGGLVDNALLTLATMIKLRDAYGQREVVDADSLVVVSLFYDLGKIGNDSLAYYKVQESEWHRTKLGQLYEVMPQLIYMPPCMRSLWWLNNFGVSLTEEEMYAISSLRTRDQNSNAAIAINYNEPFLAVMLQQAISTLTFLNKKTCILDK